MRNIFLILVASGCLFFSLQATAERCETCGPGETTYDPYPVQHGTVWYSDPGGVPGRPFAVREFMWWPPTLRNGGRMGVSASNTAYVPSMNYNVTNSWGRGYSGAQIDVPRHQNYAVGGRYTWYSAETNNLLNPAAPYSVIFPVYNLFNGNALRGRYDVYSNRADISLSIEGGSKPSWLKLSVKNDVNPRTVHVQYKDYAGGVHDYDINASPYQAQVANVDLDMATLRIFGTVFYQTHYSADNLDYSEIALDVFVKASNTYESFLIIHSNSVTNPASYNDWQITTATNSY